ncbi:hypothetical protein AJ80_06620 [Polytolypa hystricis UAMH7299]|uniref:Rhodopsin domain-containing protein n=1 Tax=Polytolypa hystricis (strain UAMH7299) TaxID=1447883 RepID=A0A2B7XVZ3_POLH7|nr:hypothetical protein AJ80_06620 [Polytolypa hystricis UAMH7299]
MSDALPELIDIMKEAYELGIGRHLWDVPEHILPEALKFFTFAQYTYMVLAGIIKLTFLFFYHRIFSPQSTLKWFIVFGIVFVVCGNLALLFAMMFTCIPVARSWDKSVEGHCIDPASLPYLSGGINSLTDVYVLVLPIPSLEVEHDEGPASVVSIVRLAMTPILNRSGDSTWNFSTIAVWAVVEIDVGILCACLTLFPAFLHHDWPKALRWSFTRCMWRKSNSSRSAENPTTRNQRTWLTQSRSSIEMTAKQRDNFETDSRENLHQERLSSSRRDSSTEDVESWQIGNSRTEGVDVLRK